MTQTKCIRCSGGGFDPYIRSDDLPEPCPLCQGTGNLERVDPLESAFIAHAIDHPEDTTGTQKAEVGADIKLTDAEMAVDDAWEKRDA